MKWYTAAALTKPYSQGAPGKVNGSILGRCVSQRSSPREAEVAQNYETGTYLTDVYVDDAFLDG